MSENKKDEANCSSIIIQSIVFVPVLWEVQMLPYISSSFEGPNIWSGSKGKATVVQNRWKVSWSVDGGRGIELKRESWDGWWIVKQTQMFFEVLLMAPWFSLASHLSVASRLPSKHLVNYSNKNNFISFHYRLWSLFLSRSYLFKFIGLLSGEQKQKGKVFFFFR